MGLANKLEEMRKEGGDAWLSIWNADATKVRLLCVGGGDWKSRLLSISFPSLETWHQSETALYSTAVYMYICQCILTARNVHLYCTREQPNKLHS